MNISVSGLHPPSALIFLSWQFSLTPPLFAHRNVVEAPWLWPFIPYYRLPKAYSTAVLTISGLWISASGKHVNCKKTGEKYRHYICSDLVSSGTLLLRTQLSCSWTDSGVVGPSPVPGAGAWMGLRPPLRVFLFRLLADWWDKVWWLCGGGSGGRSVDWLWWLAAPGRRQEQREKFKRLTSLWMRSKRVSYEARERERGISFQNAANPNAWTALFDSWCLFLGVPKKLNPFFS